jgi:hypothetical protein
VCGVGGRSETLRGIKWSELMSGSRVRGARWRIGAEIWLRRIPEVEKRLVLRSRLLPDDEVIVDEEKGELAVSTIVLIGRVRRKELNLSSMLSGREELVEGVPKASVSEVTATEVDSVVECSSLSRGRRRLLALLI